ncbi:hypothetical protein BPY_01270 [Bifidobacterium psychraerophilum]|uniref:hypothetical protein n=1 Tax=Bifidobacterium psychraerophilum TaxID=218140 RepID=UPI00310FB42F
MISETLIIAVCSSVSAIAGAAVQALVSHRHNRFDEALMIQAAIADNQRLWLWNRTLVDHIWRGAKPPPPPPPEGLFEAFQPDHKHDN